MHNYNKRRYLVECTRLISVITSTDTFKCIIIINIGNWLSLHDSVITSTDTFKFIIIINVGIWLSVHDSFL